MADGVLHDRLQHHVRHEQVGQGGSRRDAHSQPVLEPDLLNREVQPQKVQLAPQRHFLCLDVFERETKEIAESRDHRLGLYWVLLLDQDHDGAELLNRKCGCSCILRVG
jgi:hypothetical protein